LYGKSGRGHEAVWDWAARRGDGDRARGETAYLCNHHMAVECTFPIRAGGSVNVGTNLGDDRGAEGHVGHKVAVHDVDLGRVSGIVSRSCLGRLYVKPIGALGDGVDACPSQFRKVGGQNRGRDDGGGRHVGGVKRQICCEERIADV
jgi:hypothetical protein